jgi:DNA-binding HxlR family transcriptional regulator
MDRRSYNEYCGVAKALDVVGERWTLLIVRNLTLGPLRYSDLLRGLPGITTNLLAKRLKDMEEGGLIERVRGAATDGGFAYRLTTLGAELEPVVHALGKWGWRWMGQPGKGEHRSVDWLLVALRRRYVGGASLAAEIVADDVPYRMVLRPDGAEIVRGSLTTPDVRIRGSGLAVARIFLQGDTSGRGLEVEGDDAKLGVLAGAFSRDG